MLWVVYKGLGDGCCGFVVLGMGRGWCGFGVGCLVGWECEVSMLRECFCV